MVVIVNTQCVFSRVTWYDPQFILLSIYIELFTFFLRNENEYEASIANAGKGSRMS